MSSRLPSSLILFGLMVAVASCSDPTTPRTSPAGPVMVVGEPIVGTMASTSPSASPSGSAKPVVARPTPTPRPGLYAAPAWSLLVLGDSVMNAAFYKQVHWKTFWPEVYKSEPPLAYLRTLTGETTVAAVAGLDAKLTGVKGAKYAAITYGSSDAAHKVPVETYKGNLRTIVAKLREQGMTVFLSTVPYATNPKMADIGTYNEALIAVRDELQVEAGPDLYGYLRDHVDLLDPKSGHLLGPGAPKIVNTLWSTAIARVAEGEPTLPPEPPATAATVIATDSVAIADEAPEATDTVEKD